jgi:hypothetical protein
MQGLLNGIASLFIAALILVGFKGKLVLSQPQVTQTLQEVVASPTPTPSPSLTPTITPSTQPAYSVSVEDQAAWGENRFEFNAQIKNLSVKPHITNLAFYECVFVDSTSTTCKGHLQKAEVGFKRALSISDSTIAKFRVAQASYDRGRAAYGKSDWMHQHRDTSGETNTQTMSGVKIVS